MTLPGELSDNLGLRRRAKLRDGDPSLCWYPAARLTTGERSIPPCGRGVPPPTFGAGVSGATDRSPRSLGFTSS